ARHVSPSLRSLRSPVPTTKSRNSIWRMRAFSPILCAPLQKASLYQQLFDQKERVMNRCTRCSGELPAFAVFYPHCAQAHQPNFDDLIGLTIDGRYRIYRRLGQGGLSTIFAATDLETDRVVAIKISDPAQLVLREMSYAMDSNRARSYWDEMLERMRREAANLPPPHTPTTLR